LSNSTSHVEHSVLICWTLYRS